MSAAMDQALMAMSLEDVDEPFTLPDLPEYYASEKNVLSIIGRVLNPEKQSVSSVVLDMPRKWQKKGRVRGLALSRERFQFIFRSEHDLIEVLEKGLHTYNEWALVVDRWVEQPPSHFLQYVTLWVQIRNIPVNHYTAQSITALGELLGQVLEVVFDPDLPQNQDFVRVQIRFDVSRPLRKSKVINLPHGKTTIVYFFYERVQKRCYNCQRLTHEQDVCPILLLKHQEADLSRMMGVNPVKPKPELVLKDSDPLFGILAENQVGINPISGRPRIAPVVLEGLRQYLLVAEGEERKLREDKVRKSVGEAEKDLITKKIALQLEPVPVISHDLSKGKGLVFGYDTEGSSSNREIITPQGQKLKSVAIRAESYSAISRNMDKAPMLVDCESQPFYGSLNPFQIDSTVYRIGLSEAGPSGVFLTKSKPKPRRRTSKGNRKSKGKDKVNSPGDVFIKEGLLQGEMIKRKSESEMEGASKAARSKSPKMVPNEGLSPD